MYPQHYAELEDAMDYLYDFLDEDLADRVRAEREFVPAGLESLLADDSLDDYVWLWIKDSGPNGFRQYLRDGGYSEAEVRQTFAWARSEWGMNTPPHIAWLKEDGYEPPRID